MADPLIIAPDLRARVDSVAERSSRSPAGVVADAREHGHSLEWREHFVERVAKGIVAADAAQFASPADLDRVRNKYRPS